MELLGDVGHVESRSVRLEMVLVLVKDRCTVWRQTYHRLIYLFRTHLMVQLGDDAQLDAHFGPFGHSANIHARSVHGLRQTYHRLRNCFGHTR